MKKFFIIFICVILVGVVSIMGNSSFGTRPEKNPDAVYSSSYLEKFKRSKQYNGNQKIFENRIPGLLHEMRKRFSWFSLAKNWFDKGHDRVPLATLPQVIPDIQDFMKKSHDLKIIWLGHSTILLNFHGKIILIDPVFGNAAPYDFLVPRFQDPVITREALPPIDYIVISHDHYDHLEMDTIKFFKDKDTVFITPLGVGSHLIGWGVASSRIHELDWWESFKHRDFEFIATPAQHFSGRTGIHNDTTLWASWVIRNQNRSIYFSGDSGYDTHFQEIGKRYGPIDVAFIENGQYNEKWREVHMLPHESVQAFFDLKARFYFPIHWAMFKLSLHSWYEPVEKVSEGLNSHGVLDYFLSPKIGEIVTLDKFDSLEKNEFWWKKFIR